MTAPVAEGKEKEADTESEVIEPIKPTKPNTFCPGEDVASG